MIFDIVGEYISIEKEHINTSKVVPKYKMYGSLLTIK